MKNTHENKKKSLTFFFDPNATLQKMIKNTKYYPIIQWLYLPNIFNGKKYTGTEKCHVYQTITPGQFAKMGGEL